MQEHQIFWQELKTIRYSWRCMACLCSGQKVTDNNESNPCELWWPAKKGLYLKKKILSPTSLWTVSETPGWADRCHIRWAGRGVSLILLRWPTDIFLGGPTSCVQLYYRYIFISLLKWSNTWVPDMYKKYIFIVIFLYWNVTLKVKCLVIHLYFCQEFFKKVTKSLTKMKGSSQEGSDQLSKTKKREVFIKLEWKMAEKKFQMWHSQILGSFEAKNITCGFMHEN